MHNSLSAVCYHGDFSCFYLVSVATVQVHQCAHMPSHLETRLVKLLVEVLLHLLSLNYQGQTSWPVTAITLNVLLSACPSLLNNATKYMHMVQAVAASSGVLLCISSLAA